MASGTAKKLANEEQPVVIDTVVPTDGKNKSTVKPMLGPNSTPPVVPGADQVESNKLAEEAPPDSKKVEEGSSDELDKYTPEQIKEA